MSDFLFEDFKSIWLERKYVSEEKDIILNKFLVEKFLFIFRTLKVFLDIEKFIFDLLIIFRFNRSVDIVVKSIDDKLKS